ncbi:MAG: SLC26A/SulP transporter family protein [Burkholderiales bacterium]|nr:SLC26A/SulP transporter family protein [Burkholderiales bacterium]
MNRSTLSGPAATPWQARRLAGEVLAGFVASIVLVTNIVSFSALMFPGALAQGASTAIWAMLIGSAVVGLWVSRQTSLPPMASGMDSPTGAVLVVVAASAAPAVLGAGGTPAQAVQATMLLFSLATALSGALLLGLGLARWGSSLRFVPYFVVAGFLGATGWLLVAGAIRMATGHRLGSLATASWTGPEAAKLACAAAACAVFLALRRWVRWPLALPTALIAMTALGGLALHALGLAGPDQGWYLPSLGQLTPWQPVQALGALRADPGLLREVLSVLPELAVVALVALVSLVTKFSSLELSRKAAGDLDVELRAHGLATLAATPLGGIITSMQLGTTRLLESAGGRTRWSGAACAAMLGAVALLNLDLPRLVPLPIAAGLVLQIGWGFLAEAFARPLAQRAWLNLALALLIMAACVHWGYLAGILGGIVAACLLFALSYARLGVVRLHLSRAQFAGHVSRSPAAAQALAEGGEAIQIYWLSGYIFFGSSEGVFERVRRDIEAAPAQRVSHVILDFSAVAACDTSAPVSLAKLRNFCAKAGVRLACSGLADGLRGALAREGLFEGRDAPPPFADVNAALAWAEEAVLAQAGLGPAPGAAEAGAAEAEARAWLQQQLGSTAAVAELMPYLERRSFEAGQVLYRQGEAADAIDLVVAGRLAVEMAGGGAGAGVPSLRLRSITTQTVVGEMGFFGHTARSATVRAEGPATVLTLTRGRFEALRRERPDLAAAFYEFLLRTLADRIRVSERLMLALGR